MMGLGVMKPPLRDRDASVGAPPLSGAGQGNGSSSSGGSAKPLAQASRQRLGLALFHNDANPTNGVAMLHGDRLRAFESRTALPSHGVWISTAVNGAVAQNFRPKDFLRSSLEALSDDIGVMLRDVVEGVPNMARFLDEISHILAACYRWEDPQVAWTKPSLAEVLREAYPRTPDPKPGIVAPLRDAFQSYSAVPDRVVIKEGAGPQRQYTLRHNRLEYAMFLLSRPVPDPSAEWFMAEFQSVDEVLSCGLPTLTEVALEFDPPTAANPIDYSRLCAFGSTMAGRRSPGVVRRWVSAPELLWLSRHAHVHVQQVLACSSPAIAIDPIWNLPAALRSDPLLCMSIAAGVIAEAHWVGLTMKRLRRREHSGASSKFEEIYSPMAVWLKAYDRAYGFYMANQAAQMGYEVVGYGYGALTVQADRNEPSKLLELVDHLGVCHPNLASLQNRIDLGGSEYEIQP